MIIKVKKYYTTLKLSTKKMHTVLGRTFITPQIRMQPCKTMLTVLYRAFVMMNIKEMGSKLHIITIGLMVLTRFLPICKVLSLKMKVMMELMLRVIRYVRITLHTPSFHKATILQPLSSSLSTTASSTLWQSLSSRILDSIK